MKHIEFSNGFYFLDDLQQNLKEAYADLPNLSGKDLEFTYNLKTDLKIDVQKAKEKKL